MGWIVYQPDTAFFCRRLYSKHDWLSPSLKVAFALPIGVGGAANTCFVAAMY